MAIIKHMTNHASYDEIMERLDNALIKNESLQDEIKILRHNELVNAEEIKVLKNKNELSKDAMNFEILSLKEGKKELVKDVELLNDEIKILNNMIYQLVQDQTEEIKALKKHNDYYISQIKAIKTIAEKPLNLCDNLNDIIAICCDMGIEFNDINLGNKGGRNA